MSRALIGGTSISRRTTVKSSGSGFFGRFTVRWTTVPVLALDQRERALERQLADAAAPSIRDDDVALADPGLAGGAARRPR